VLATVTGTTFDGPIRLGATELLPGRLVAERVPLAVATERRRRLHADAKRRGQMVSQARLAVADWTVYATNLPPDRASGEEVLILARARWQAGLVFKRWKSLGGLALLRSRNPYRVLAEVFAKLLGALLTHWVALTTCWNHPRRSLHAATTLVQQAALAIALALNDAAALARLLTALTPAFRAVSVASRRRKPAFYQLVATPPPIVS